jgi:pimeloyl-ACP methyl ester carboxylesterase
MRHLLTARRPRRMAKAGIAVAAVVAAGGTLLAQAAAASQGARYFTGRKPAEHNAQSALAPTDSLDPLPVAIPDDLRPYYQQKLTWQACSDMTGFQCAQVRVPLDYQHPSGATDIRLAIARKLATGPGPRLGSLLVNPGGPGGSAIDYLQEAAAQFPASVRAVYDMAGVDPRGVGRSDPIQCLTNAQMDAFTQVPTPSTPSDRQEVNSLAAADKTFANACKQRSGALLAHVSTIDSARDMDIVRALLGDAKLNYVGKSYGTFLGATYAGLFPSRVGRLVLDGAMDPSLTALEQNRTQAAGFENAFESFARDCVARSGCPMGRSLPETNAYVTRFLQRLRSHPLPTVQGRPLVESLGMTGLMSAMYSKDMWPILRTALTKADAKDGSWLLALSDVYYERDKNGQYSNLMYANSAVNCLDLPPAATSPAAVRAELPSFQKASPHFGSDFAWQNLSCAWWPVKATGHSERIEAKGAAPILVVGTLRDPATPYAWAKGLAGQLQSARLLSYDGDGHTAYAMGNDCVDTAVNAYLLQGMLPPEGKLCTASVAHGPSSTQSLQALQGPDRTGTPTG